MYNPIVRICNRYLIGSSDTCEILGFARELTFEGVCSLGFTCKYYGVFHQENVYRCSDQGIYILGLLELFHDTKF